MMRPLLIGDEQIRQIQSVVEFASRPENRYVPGVTSTPGLLPQLTMYLPIGYRCVFSFTQVDAGLYRHLSVSVDAACKLPNPHAVAELAKRFGFTGERDKDWECGINDDEPFCVQAVQKVEIQA